MNWFNDFVTMFEPHEWLVACLFSILGAVLFHKMGYPWMAQGNVIAGFLSLIMSIIAFWKR